MKKKKDQLNQISDIVLSLINYNYVGKKNNLELIVRLLSQMVLRYSSFIRLGNKLDYSTYINILKKILSLLSSSRQKPSARQLDYVIQDIV